MLAQNSTALRCLSLTVVPVKPTLRYAPAQFEANAAVDLVSQRPTKAMLESEVEPSPAARAAGGAALVGAAALAGGAVSRPAATADTAAAIRA